MDRSGTFVVHVNPCLKNQTLYAGYLSAGLSKVGADYKISHDPSEQGDIHICIGPHFAFDQCLGKPTIYIDRCLWGDDLDYVTIGWLGDDGGMVYPSQYDDARPKPELMPEKQGDTVIALYDYGMTLRDRDAHVHRYHPATRKSPTTLEQDLSRCHKAIGRRTSALATAVIHGLAVTCYDKRCPAYGYDTIGRENWLNKMSYAQWSGKEIASGEALEYVINSI